MRQGTTPLHTFVLPFPVPEGSLVRIVYAQRPGGVKKVKFVKTKDDVKVDGQAVSTRLTQEDTFSVEDQYPVLAQVRVLTPEGEALGSKVVFISSEECLEDYVMTFEEEPA